LFSNIIAKYFIQGNLLKALKFRHIQNLNPRKPWDESGISTQTQNGRNPNPMSVKVLYIKNYLLDY